MLSGSLTVQATATGLTADSATFTVVAGAADHLTFTSSTANLTSGSGRILTAEVRDAAGNVLVGDNTTSVNFAKTAGTGTVTGLGPVTAASGLASQPVTASLAGSITVTASAAGLTADTTTFTVVHGTADQLVFTSSSSNLASGAGRTLTVELRDAAGNVLTADSSTVVTFAKTAGTGTVTGLGAATASSGVATKAVTADVAGAITITASAAGLTSGTTSFAIDPGAADHLTFTSSTANLTSGAARTLTAEVRDAAGNVVTADNATSVSFAKTAGAGTVTGLGAVTAASGVASTSVSASAAGAITIQATASGLSSDSTSFTIVPGAADHLTVTSATSSLASGSARTLTAEVRDAAGNLVGSDNTTSVTLRQERPAPAPSAGLGAATASAVSPRRPVTGDLAGPITITASAGGLTADTTSFTIVPGPASKLLIGGSVANLASGAARALTATVQDAAGNTLTADNTTSVSFAQTAGSGSLTGLGAATAAERRRDDQPLRPARRLGHGHRLRPAAHQRLAHLQRRPRRG